VPARREAGGIGVVDRHAPGGAEGDVAIAGRGRAPAGDDPEAGAGHAVGDRAGALVHAAHPDREEDGVVEGRRALEVAHLNSHVVDHRRAV
jgi:hypothetical protein